MKITKIGHCCLVLEVEGLRIMTDPGMFTAESHAMEEGVDMVLVTHEHADHLHVPSLKKVLEKNPDAFVVSNASVAKFLHKEGIEPTHIGGGESAEVKGIHIEGFGHDHATIYKDQGLVENTGYMIAEKFYMPGDSFFAPGKPVDILALPVAAPWLKIADAIEFAKAVKARIAFGVHDAIMVPAFRGFPIALMEKFVPETEYVSLADGASKDF